MKKFLKKYWYIFLIIGVIIGFVGGKNFIFKDQVAKEKTYKIQKQTLKETISFSGYINAFEKTTLRFQTSGRLTWVGVKEGDFVKKYQTVATLDKRELQDKLDKNLNSYLKTRWDFEQTKDNYENSVLTDSIKRILEKSQYDLNSSVKDVEIQNLAIEYANLFSPIEGLVTRVNSPLPGINITPSQAEFDIVNPLSVYFSATVDQADLNKISEGKQGKIIFDTYPDEEINGQIKTISFVPQSGDTGTSYEMKITFQTDNSNYKYRLGMTGDATFLLKEKNNVLVVPYSFIKTEKDKKFVNVKKNQELIKTFIKTGDETTEEVEVVDGIKEGDIIVQ